MSLGSIFSQVDRGSSLSSGDIGDVFFGLELELVLCGWILLQPSSSPSIVMRYEETIPSVQILFNSVGIRLDLSIVFFKC